MNRGDTVQLIVPEKGRKCVGKILREIKGSYQVGLPNGLYIILPKDRWELCDKSISVPDNIESQENNAENKDSVRIRKIHKLKYRETSTLPPQIGYTKPHQS